MSKGKESAVVATHWDHFTPSPLGLKIIGDPTYDQWAKCGEFFQLAERTAQWWIGDWLNYGEKSYGEKYAQAGDLTGLRKQTLMNLKWVASKFEISRRRENLTFRHHAEVAALGDKDADKWLNRAEREELSAGDLRRMIQGEKAIITPAIEAKPPESADILADDSEPEVVDADPAKCLEAVAGMAKALKKWRAFFSAIMASPFAGMVINAAGGFSQCDPAKTGERVEIGSLGPYKFGPLEYSTPAIDELLNFGGNLRAMFNRCARPEVPGEGVGEWERQ